jgi:hypothetical protein
LFGAAIVTGEGFFAVAPAQEFIRPGQKVSEQRRAKGVGLGQGIQVRPQIL